MRAPGPTIPRAVRPPAVLTMALLVAGLSGCAGAPRQDPLEPWNRKVFAFNETVDEAVMKPVATAYQKAVPSLVRTGVTNFFNNVHDVWSAVNLVLQGRPAEAGSELIRFTTNTFFGVLGLFDVATDLGIERYGEDLGQTLGRWGLPAGPYLVLPVLGPSSVRDVVDVPIDLSLSAENAVDNIKLRNSLTGVRLVNKRANLLGATRVLDDVALDKYTFVRDAYLQRRRSQVYDGYPPDEPADDEDPPPKR